MPVLNKGDNRIISLPPYWTKILMNSKWKMEEVLTDKNNKDLLFEIVSEYLQ